MLTIFSTPKPFIGHIGVIQRNALQSWKRLHPDVEVILFGDEEGAAETARELGIRHEPAVPKADAGVPYVNGLFERAQNIARHRVVCYLNCDIVLTSRFRNSLEQVAGWRRAFLMFGHRWDTDISQPLDFCQSDWEQSLLLTALESGKRQNEFYIDYFAFPKDLFGKLPPLVVGRSYWDGWLLWKARSEGATLIDVSPVFQAIHQNHDHSHHPEGVKGVWGDSLAKENFRLAGGWGHLFTLDDADYRLTDKGLARNYLCRFAPLKRSYHRLTWDYTWVPLMDLTRPLRRRLGIGPKSAQQPDNSRP